MTERGERQGWTRRDAIDAARIMRVYHERGEPIPEGLAKATGEIIETLTRHPRLSRQARALRLWMQAKRIALDTAIGQYESQRKDSGEAYTCEAESPGSP